MINSKQEKDVLDGIIRKIKVFEGPLDLLLHLIQNKVNIYDIPIVEITNQYMAYIREMRQRVSNIMSEFLSWRPPF